MVYWKCTGKFCSYPLSSSSAPQFFLRLYSNPFFFSKDVIVLKNKQRSGRTNLERNEWWELDGPRGQKPRQIKAPPRCFFSYKVTSMNFRRSPKNWPIFQWPQKMKVDRNFHWTFVSIVATTVNLNFLTSSSVFWSKKDRTFSRQLFSRLNRRQVTSTSRS